MTLASALPEPLRCAGCGCGITAGSAGAGSPDGIGQVAVLCVRCTETHSLAVVALEARDVPVAPAILKAAPEVRAHGAQIRQLARSWDELMGRLDALESRLKERLGCDGHTRAPNTYAIRREMLSAGPASEAPGPRLRLADHLEKERS